MKFKNISWILIIVVIPIAFHGVGENISLNHYAVQTSKTIFNPSRLNTSHISLIPEESNLHRIKWLNFIHNNIDSQENQIDTYAEGLLVHSSLYMRMLRILFPTDLVLAKKAIKVYPMDTLPLYWLSESMSSKTTLEKKPIYEKILSLNPADGLAWRYLGIILIAEKNIPGAIQAHINSCNNGDPGVNGCFNAGRLLEQEGRFEEAIYYYRLSRWQPSQDKADRLEAELSSQDP